MYFGVVGLFCTIFIITLNLCSNFGHLGLSKGWASRHLSSGPNTTDLGAVFFLLWASSISFHWKARGEEIDRARRADSEYMCVSLCKWIFRGVIGSQSFQNTLLIKQCAS